MEWSSKKFAYNNSYQASIGTEPYKLFMGKMWYEVGERKILELEIVKRTCKHIWLNQDLLQTTQSRQEGYVDKLRKMLKFEIWDKVFQWVVPMKGIMIFGKE